MPSAPDPPPPPLKPRKRWLPRLRFSLRTLLIMVLLVGSAGGLWWKWEPWGRMRSVPVGGIQRIAISPDARKFAIVLHNDRVLHLLDADSLTELASSEALPSNIADVSFAPDSRRMVVVCADLEGHLERKPECVFVLDARSGKRIAGIRGDQFDFAHVVLSPDGSQLFTKAALDHNLTVFDANTGALKYRVGEDSGISPCGTPEWFEKEERERKHADDNAPLATTLPMFAAAVNPVHVPCILASQGEVVCCWSEAEYVWDTQTGRRLAVLEHAPFNGILSPGKRWLVGEHDRQTLLYDFASGRQAYVIPSEFNDFSPPRFADNDERMLTGQGDEPYRVWDLRNGTSICTLQGKVINIDDAILTPDGTRVIARYRGEEHDALTIWDATTGTVLSRFGEFESVEFHLLNSDCMVIATEKDLSVWHRRRPEYWWGVAWLPEFWLTALFAGALGWSVWQDRKQPEKSIA